MVNKEYFNKQIINKYMPNIRGNMKNKNGGKLPLFAQYPLLKNKLPYVQLGQFPTPIEKLEIIGRELKVSQLYIKRDDLSGAVYGGNKIRKLEFLLGEAIWTGAKEVMTFGAAGSNHALATAIYAKQLGMKGISVLVSQPNADYVRRNLLMSYHCGAELHLCKTHLESCWMRLMLSLMCRYQMLLHRLRCGCFPYVIPPGGSNPLGTVGYVNAAFELKQQILSGEMPEPTHIYVACGTMGTVAGLMIGLKAAKLKSRVVPVRVTSGNFVNPGAMKKLIKSTISLLNSRDPSFPRIEFTEGEVGIRNEFFGKQYALFTKEGVEAIAHFRENEGIKLEGTYTGKTFAAVINDAAKGYLKDEVVLFWNTANSKDFSKTIEGLSYHNLPRPFHCYFEKDVQPLDRTSHPS
jgi:1-aminocyclopropane-1-carboxylate deaminase/D-cysteine desulfhydrase-like pyridoxal-dependent ACC family enzyme